MNKGHIAILLGCLISAKASNPPSSAAENLISAFSPSVQIGLCVLDANAGLIIDERDSKKNLIPASTMKLFTTWTALALLGPEKRWKTTLEHSGKISGNTLKGNLVIRGSGDPAFCSGSFGKPYSRKTVFDGWLKALREKGVKQVEGCVWGDDRAVKSLTPNPHALWEDIGNYYGAITSGLCFMDNRFHLFFKGAAGPGMPVQIIGTEPVFTGIEHLDNRVQTSATGGGDSAYILGSPLSSNRLILGTYPAGKEEFHIKGSLPYPAWTSAMEFFHFLRSNGIKFTIGKTCRDYQSRPSSKALDWRLQDSMQIIASHLSPSVKKLVRHINLKSDNTYTEQLLCMLGKRRGGSGDYKAGLREMIVHLEKSGLDIQSLNFKDGSGLSRYNWVSTSQICSLLKAAARDKKHFKPFLNSLYCLTEGHSRYSDWGKSFQGNLWLKTGYMEGVYAMAGYLKTRGGKLLCYAFIVNHCGLPPPAIRRVVFQYLAHIRQNR